MQRLSDLQKNGGDPRPVSPSQDEFFKALDDDLNISGALGHLFETIRETNRALDQNALSTADARALLDWWNQVNTVLGLEPDSVSIPAEVLTLVEERQAARVGKDWAGSDRIRDQIAALGWQVKDTKEGPKVTKL